MTEESKNPGHAARCRVNSYYDFSRTTSKLQEAVTLAIDECYAKNLEGEQKKIYLLNKDRPALKIAEQVTKYARFARVDGLYTKTIPFGNEEDFKCVAYLPRQVDIEYLIKSLGAIFHRIPDVAEIRKKVLPQELSEMNLDPKLGPDYRRIEINFADIMNSPRLGNWRDKGL